MEAGTGDYPNSGQGDPSKPGKFHPAKEYTAWWLAADYISRAAKESGVIKTHLLSEREGFPPKLLPNTQWYALKW